MTTTAEWAIFCTNVFSAKSLKNVAAARKAKVTEIEKRKMRSDPMKQPTTMNEIMAMHKILRSDPHRYLRIVNEWIRQNPQNHQAYFSRHLVWEKIGAPGEATRSPFSRPRMSIVVSVNTIRRSKTSIGQRQSIPRSGGTLRLVHSSRRIRTHDSAIKRRR